MIVLAVLFAALIAAEFVATRWAARPVYEQKETELSFALLTGFLAAGYVASFVTAPVIERAYHPRFAGLDGSTAEAALLVIVGDFFYYWAHRLSHEIRWLWASHVAHHTSERLNFLASLRQGWTDLLSGLWLLWLPLGLIGFAPTNWNVYYVAVAIWQFWVHNEWAGRLGVLEWMLVTPSHHRVHHSIAPEHVDRNYGGIFIIWDRLFGTFTDEGAVPIARFGISGGNRPAKHPFSLALHEWRSLLADVARRGGPGEKLGCVLRRAT